jgi:DNA-binding NarL/FixJ family response regulator
MLTTLIVDDNQAFRTELRTFLTASFPAMLLTEAADGMDALHKIDALDPDLIFMDIHLQDENGLDLTKKIKSLYREIIIIVLTNYDLPEYREAAFAFGANYFVAKSASPDEMMKIVCNALAFKSRDCSPH